MLHWYFVWNKSQEGWNCQCEICVFQCVMQKNEESFNSCLSVSCLDLLVNILTEAIANLTGSHHKLMFVQSALILNTTSINSTLYLPSLCFFCNQHRFQNESSLFLIFVSITKCYHNTCLLHGGTLTAAQFLKDNYGRTKYSMILILVWMNAYWATAPCVGLVPANTVPLSLLFIALYQNKQFTFSE